jgi:hypothetical protein
MVEVASAVALVRLAGGVIKSLEGTVGSKILEWNTEAKIEGLYKKIKKIEKVKTIWQVSKAISLETFYVEPHVVIDGKRTRVKTFSQFGTRSVLVEGIAGQGKSIYLKSLCIEELKAGSKIPIFIELRRIGSNQSLFEQIQISLKGLGLTVDQKLFGALAQSGKILLLLDGFDEVATDRQKLIVNEIEDLININEELNLVVSSRLDSSLRSSPALQVVRLDNLQGVEYEKLVEKLCSNDEYAENLKKVIEASPSSVKELLCTPLLVTFMVMLYKTYQLLPQNLSDFYGQVFQLLLLRHDGAKPGYKRERLCDFNDSEYREIFEAMCYFSKANTRSVFTIEQLINYIDQAFENLSKKGDPHKYLKDIEVVTNMILKESEEYTFIHKSIQEFFAASFLVKKPDSSIKKFYQKLLDKPVGARRWEQEIRFLSEIDTYRYFKFYFIPFIHSYFKISGAADLNSIKVDLDFVVKYFGRMYLYGITPEAKARFGSMSYQIAEIPASFRHIFDVQNLFSKIDPIVRRAVFPDEKLIGITQEKFKKAFPNIPKDDYFKDLRHFFTLELFLLPGNRDLEANILKIFLPTIEVFKLRYLAAVDFVEQAENQDILDLVI